MAIDLNYGIGVEGKNLVLKTLGRVYVKVKDRKYELKFKPEDLRDIVEQYAGDNSSSETPANEYNLLFVGNSKEVEQMDYPGNGYLIITKDGYFYYTEAESVVPIPIKFSDTELTLENLTITKQLFLTGSEVPIVINNNALIEKLNADLLDGYHATDFAKKNQSETISGSWIFTGTTMFTNAVGTQTLKDNNGGNRISINFQTGEIKCRKLTMETDPDKVELVSGIGQEVWVGLETKISDITEETDYEANDKFDLVSAAYEDGSLPNSPGTDEDIDWELETFWYPLFFSNYDTTSKTYTLRNFSDPDVWNEANTKFDGSKYSLGQFQNMIYGLSTYDLSQFTGNIYNITLSDDVDMLSMLPNMLVKDSLGNIGVILERNEDRVTVKTIDTSTQINGTKLIVTGSLGRDGGILLNSANPSISILKDALDENSHSVYFGELSKVDSSKSGIGMILNGSESETLLTNPTLDNIRNFQNKTEINIQNPSIKWIKDSNIKTIFNQDGSGYLSNGIIRWGDNKLYLDGADIINSRINNTGITNSSFQSGNILINTDGSGHIGDKIEFNTTTVTKNTPMGPAGGDLIGDYPNPTINDGAITTNKIANGAVTSDKLANSAVTSNKLADGSVTTNKIVNGSVTSDKIVNSAVTIAKLGSDVINRFTTIETDIDNIQSKVTNIESDISDLQNSVSSLSGTVNSHTTSISNIGNTLSSHAGSINNLQLQVNEQREDITDLEQRVTTLENTVGTLNTTLENRLNGN